MYCSFNKLPIVNKNFSKIFNWLKYWFEAFEDVLITNIQNFHQLHFGSYDILALMLKKDAIRWQKKTFAVIGFKDIDNFELGKSAKITSLLLIW